MRSTKSRPIGFISPSVSVFIGTSITGERPLDGITSEGTFATLIGREKGFKKYWNAGVSNDTTSLMLDRYESDVLKMYPGMVAIEVGPNDEYFSVPVATSEGNLRSMIRMSKTQGEDVTLIVPLLVRDPTTDLAVNDWRELTRDLAGELGCNLFDIYEEMAALDGGTLDTYYLTGDDYHLSAIGHTYVANKAAEPEHLDAFVPYVT